MFVLLELSRDYCARITYLLSFFTGIIIQSEVHDSAEDARTALQLYRKYEELKAEGTLQSALQELYEVGKKSQWKVPEECEKEKSKSKETESKKG